MTALLFLSSVALAKDGEGCARPPAELSQTSAALYAMFAADMADRSSHDPNTAKNDATRLSEVRRLSKDGQICSGLDNYHAAVVLLHSDLAADIARAYELAVSSMNHHVPQGPWAVANTFDRWRISRGLTQSYGTGTGIVKGKPCMYPLDAAFTDDQRAQYDIEPVEKAIRRVLDAAGETSAPATWRELEKQGMVCKVEAWK